MGAPEAYVEKYLVKRCKESGFLCWKLTCPATSGVPDRLVGGNGKLCFIEVKRPGARPRKLQDVRIAQLHAAGAIAGFVDTREGVDELIDWMRGVSRHRPDWLR